MVGERCLQSAGAVEVDYADEGAVAEMVLDSGISVGAGGMEEEAHEGDGAAAPVVVDDEVPSASLGAAPTTLHGSPDCRWREHLHASFQCRCCRRHLSVCAHVRCDETVPATEPACPYRVHWNC